MAWRKVCMLFQSMRLSVAKHPPPKSSAEAERLAVFYEDLAAQMRRWAADYEQSDARRKLWLKSHSAVRKYVRTLLEKNYKNVPCPNQCRLMGIDYTLARHNADSLRPRYKAAFKVKRDRAIMKMKAKGLKTGRIAAHFGLHRTTVQKIVSGQR